MLEIRGLRKKYGNFQALDGLDLEIPKGELFGFVGPNGAGKTTTLKIVAGLLAPDEGEVRIDGVDAVRNNKALREKIGYVPDFFGVYDNLKVSEYMEFFASCYGIEEMCIRDRDEESGGIWELMKNYESTSEESRVFNRRIRNRIVELAAALERTEDDTAFQDTVKMCIRDRHGGMRTHTG